MRDDFVFALLGTEFPTYVAIDVSIIGDRFTPFPTLPPKGEGLLSPLPSGEG